MLILPPLPPPEPPRINAVEHRICPPRDSKCHLEFLNDAGEALVQVVNPSDLSSTRTFDIVASASGAGDMAANLEHLPQ